MYGAIIVLVATQSIAEQAVTLHLADAGRTAYTIVLHRNATPPERHAAQELARFLGEISGATFPVREMDAVPTNLDSTIRIGVDAVSGIVSPMEISRLGQEGYILRSKGPVLAIVGGRPRGTLYAVYSFLEDKLGCRWFTPRVSRIPKKTAIEIGPLDRTFAPPLEYRDLDSPDSCDADWAARNKINGTHARLDKEHGDKISYGPFVHTFEAILNPKTSFRVHPEYFSEVNGKRLALRTQLCLTNPDVLRIATATVRRWMREQPAATIFSVSQNDWKNYCTCPNCARITAEEGSPIGPYLRFVNAIVDAVREEFPDKVVDTLAYQFTRQPPLRTRPRPNVIVRLCDIECCFAHPLASSAEVDKENASFARDLRRWSEISQRLYVWDYVTNFAHAIMPFPNLYVLKPNIAFLVEHGVKGIYEEGNYFSRGGEFAELRAWILAKTLWDPSYDTDGAISDFLTAYYGEAAAPVRRYIDLIHEKVRKDRIHFHIFDGPSSPLFSEDLLAQAALLFDEAEQRVAAKAAFRQRLQVARLPLLYVQIAKLSATLRKSSAPGRQDRERLRLLFERFDTIARGEGVTHVGEQRSYESWASNIRRQSESP
jgi:Domain of unknown function (DUF4838)/Glycosyl hydrolase family 67 N-terminus